MIATGKKGNCGRWTACTRSNSLHNAGSKYKQQRRELETGKQLSAVLPIVTNTPSSERLLGNLTASSKEDLEEVRGEIPALEEG